MTKKISKLLLTLLLIVLTISSFSVCYAEVGGVKTKSVTQGEAVTTSETEDSTTTGTSNEESTEEIHNGDLYIFDNDVLMDKLVDGNVFIFGTNVEITGQVNGNLFVCANKVSFNQSYIRYSIFACANSIYYNGACNDLYAATTDLEMTYDSYVVRDVKAVGTKAIFTSAIGRDADLIFNNIDFGEGENIPVIYGNLRYSTKKEIEIPEGIISGEGTTTYTKPSELDNNSISSILIGFAACIVTVLIVYAIAKRSTSNFAEKLSNKKLSVSKILKAFLIGLASIIIVLIAFILLLSTAIGMNLALILILIYALLCLVAIPALTIVITNALKPAFKIEKCSMFCLILVLISIILHGITLIPFVGEFLGFVIKMVAIGLLIDIYLPHKELTDEEKAAIAEAKKQAKENKAKRKQEKLEAKLAKKKKSNINANKE